MNAACARSTRPVAHGAQLREVRVDHMLANHEAWLKLESVDAHTKDRDLRCGEGQFQPMIVQNASAEKQSRISAWSSAQLELQVVRQHNCSRCWRIASYNPC